MRPRRKPRSLASAKPSVRRPKRIKPPRRWKEFGEDGAAFLADTAARYGANIPAVLQDLLTTVVRVCRLDYRERRGKHWRRELSLLIRVQEPDRWNNAAVHLALQRVLECTTGDRWRLTFEMGEPALCAPVNGEFNFDEDKTRCVALTSEGLDSLCGIRNFLHDPREDVLIAVNVSTQRERASLFDRNLRGLPAEQRGRVHLHRFEARGALIGKAREPSQRSKSFFYLALAAAAAHLAQAERILIFENGDEALHFPLQRGLDYAHTSRLMHPIGVARMQSLVDLLLPNAPRFAMPFLSKTKSEVIRLVADNLTSEDAARAVSCERFSSHTRCVQCGHCSECIRRQQAMQDAGFADESPYSKPIRTMHNNLSPKEMKDWRKRDFGFAELATAWHDSSNDDDRFDRVMELSGLDGTERNELVPACARLTYVSECEARRQVVHLYERLLASWEHHKNLPQGDASMSPQRETNHE